MKVYQDNIKCYEAKTLRLKKVLNKISLLRLIIFVVSVIILVYLIKLKLFSLVLIVFPLLVICFGAAVKYYDKINFLKKHTAFLKGINESEILKEECNLEKFDTGDRFVDHNHPYSADLDIFGEHSIFQLLNRTTTESGMILLSEWLLEPAPNNEIYDGQKAIKELSPKLNWRQDFQAHGMHFQNKKSDYYKLLDWVKEPLLLWEHRLVYIVFAIVLSTLSLLGLYFSIINMPSSNRYAYILPFITVLVINYIILRKVKAPADDIVKTSQNNIDILKGYRTLIDKIESEAFESKRLSELQSILTKGKYSAFNEINQLCRLLEFSQQRG